MGRGPSPRDANFFHANQLPKLSAATLDLSFLFSRGYAESAALRLVGNRYQLRERQRLAVLRSAASPQQIELRRGCELFHCSDDPAEALAGQTLDIDGFNLVILLEAATGGGVLLRGADGCLRDLSSVHGNYRLVSQTAEVLEEAGLWLAQQQVAGVRWWFDAPVSNSGRLVTLVREMAQRHRWPWEAQTSNQVDQVVAASPDVAISSDKIILQECLRWANIGRELVAHMAPEAWVIDLPQQELRGSLDGFSSIPS